MKLNRRKFVRNGISLGLLFSLPGSISAKSSGISDNPDNIFEIIKSRRSVRKFKSDPIPKEDLNSILEAANNAPSPRNRQDWKFLVVNWREILDQIKEECIKRSGENSREYFTDYLSAPLYIIILANTNTRNPDNDIIAGALAAENLFLAARALGYGTVFCANSIPEEVTRQALNIPENYKRLCITPVGVPSEWPACPEKKSLQEVVYYNSII
ncbi:MAG: nitroreductase family protein [Bacteroidales bacterium]|nr:nitroreductase family protein [Bacteroidales bacterium]